MRSFPRSELSENGRKRCPWGKGRWVRTALQCKEELHTSPMRWWTAGHYQRDPKENYEDQRKRWMNLKHFSLAVKFWWLYLIMVSNLLLKKMFSGIWELPFLLARCFSVFAWVNWNLKKGGPLFNSGKREMRKEETFGDKGSEKLPVVASQSIRLLNDS